jgi:hypothetical protein
VREAARLSMHNRGFSSASIALSRRALREAIRLQKN